MEAWIVHSKWSKKPEIMDNLRNFFLNKYIPKALNYLKRETKRAVPIVDMCMVETLTKMLDVLLDADGTNCEAMFVFCSVYALGCNLGNLDGKDFRREFSKWWTSFFKGTSIKYGSKTVFD